MNVIRKLTWVTLKKNRRRTVITIFGTAVAVAMVTAIAILVASFVDMVHEAAVAENGEWHISYYGLDKKALPLLRKHENTEFVDVSQSEGFAMLPGREDYTRKALAVVAYTPESYQRLPINLSAGRLPEKPGEILLSDNFLKTGGMGWDVDETVQLDFGWFIQEMTLAGGATERIPIRSVAESSYGMEWHSAGVQPFTVVGYADIGRLEQGWQDAFTALTVFDPETAPGDSGPLTAYVGLHSIGGDTYVEGDELGEEIFGQLGYSFGIGYNSEVIGSEGGFASARVFEAFAVFFVILLGIVLLGSVSLISNAFSISLAERVRSLGMLAGVGATRKQKRASVFSEAIFIGIFAIPIGVLGGIVGIGVTLALLGSSIGVLFDSGAAMRLVVPGWVLVFAVLFSIFILLLSAWGPARRASKIAPVEAMRSGGAKGNIRRVKVSGFIRRLFGFEAELGIKNSKRNRRRYLAILSSLIISVVLFLTVTAAMQYLRESLGLVQSEPTKYNVEVMLSPYYTDTAVVYPEGTINGVRALPDAGTIDLYARAYGETLLPESAISADGRKMLQGEEDGGYLLHPEIYAVDDETWLRWCGAAGIPSDILGEEGLAGVLLGPINTRTEDGGFTQIQPLQLAAGDMLPLGLSQQNDVGSVTELSAGDMRIVAISPHFPDFVQSQFYSANILPVITTISNARTYLDFYQRNSYPITFYMMAQSPNAAALYEDVEEKIVNDDFHVRVYNNEASNRRAATGILVLTVFTYGFVILITLVCAANIFNTISTGIALRAREFAMLRSAGLTPRAFNKMLDCETLFYGVKALLWGIPISVLLSALLFRSLNRGFGFAFSLPFWAYGIAVFGVFILVGLSVLYARSKVRRLNIAETLKNENW